MVSSPLISDAVVSGSFDRLNCKDTPRRYTAPGYTPRFRARPGRPACRATGPGRTAAHSVDADADIRLAAEVIAVLPLLVREAARKIAGLQLDKAKGGVFQRVEA